MKVTKDMTVEEVVQSNPKAAQILMTYEIGCIGCPVSQQETIEEAAKSHNINVNNLIDALN
jgi:hybrid cluster-associated redox disulfide protein